MSQFDAIISAMKAAPYSAKKHLLEYTLHLLKNLPEEELTEEDKSALLAYALEEVDVFLADIAEASSYRQKDEIFTCEDFLLCLILQLCPSPKSLPEGKLERINLLADTVAKERYLETYLDGLFKQDSISEEEMLRLIAMVQETEDEFQKGLFYTGLVHYREQLSKLSPLAKLSVAEHLVNELNRYLGSMPCSEECLINLELMADISRYFGIDPVIDLLYELLKLGYRNINYYTTDTLLCLGRPIPAEVIDELAHDLEYANLTYCALKAHGKQDAFPADCASEEYLAKSDLTRWLMYPTELGKAPDEMEFLGKVDCPYDEAPYFVFKYRSDSDTLGEELQNKWLIGWSSEDGGTFSNFDEYALYEKDTLEATLQNILETLIG